MLLLLFNVGGNIALWIIQIAENTRGRWASNDARWLKAFVDTVSAVGALSGDSLRKSRFDVCLFVNFAGIEIPVICFGENDIAVGTGRDACTGAPAPVLINQHYPILTADNCLIGACLETRSVIAMVAQDGNIDPLDVWIGPNLNIEDPSEKRVQRSSVLLLASHRTGIASDAARQVD